MEKIDEQELRALVDMTETIGWKVLVREAEDSLIALEKAAIQATSIEALQFLKGQYNELSYLISFEDIIRAELETKEIEEEEGEE